MGREGHGDGLMRTIFRAVAHFAWWLNFYTADHRPHRQPWREER